MILKNVSLTDIESMVSSLPQDTAIGEVAGRDSTAAIVKAFERNDINTILPIASLGGIEYGDHDNIMENYNLMVQRIKDLYGDEKTLLPLVQYSRPDLWYAINGRFIHTLNKDFGFYTPCIGCHAYFHTLRAPIAYRLGKKIISGERGSHDGGCKINQLPEVLQAYKDIMSQLEIELIHPIKDIVDGTEIDEILGFNYIETELSTQCVFSGNYKDVHGNVNYDLDKINLYMNKFISPVCIQIGRNMIEENEYTKNNFINTVSDILEEMVIS